jgi:hypothetical protein
VNTGSKTLLIGLVLASSALIAAVGWWNCIWSRPDEVEQIQFDAVAWTEADPLHASAKDRWRTARSQMIDDLLNRYRFDGWTRQQVIDLLGPPTDSWSGFEQWDLIYVLGLERGGAFSLDDEALGFKFDETDLVVKYGLSVN